MSTFAPAVTPVGGQHQAVMDAVRRSEPSVARVAMDFEARGFEVLLPATRLAPTFSDRSAYSDDGDLRVGGRRVEVRHNHNDDFHDLLSWLALPHQRRVRRFFTSYVREFQTKTDPPPWAYIQVNQPMTHAGITYRRDVWAWSPTPAMTLHKITRRPQPTYWVDPALVCFYPLLGD